MGAISFVPLSTPLSTTFAYQMKNKSPKLNNKGLNFCAITFEKPMVSTRPPPLRGNTNIIFLILWTSCIPEKRIIKAHVGFSTSVSQQASPLSPREMAVPRSWGVVRYVIFVGTTVLFCFQISNVSPTANPPGIVSTQTSHNSQVNTRKKACKPREFQSKIRFLFLLL